jgi:RNA polymerase sigma factor (sigma-70 family)
VTALAGVGPDPGGGQDAGCIQFELRGVEYSRGSKRPVARYSMGVLQSTILMGDAETTHVVLAARARAPDAPVSAVDALRDPMRRLQARDQAALGELYDLTCARLFGLAQAILRNRQDAEEVVCDCYTQAWTDAARYDPERASVMGWLTMLCRSRALDRLRQRRHEHLAVEVEAAESVQDPGPPPEDLLSMVEDGSRVHAALARLPEERRELVALAFLRGLSHQEIADLKQLPLGTVKSHVRRSLLQLREALDDPTLAQATP